MQKAVDLLSSNQKYLEYLK